MFVGAVCLCAYESARVTSEEETSPYVDKYLRASNMSSCDYTVRIKLFKETHSQCIRLQNGTTTAHYKIEQ